eukprot:gb/GECH01004907.1/.p1 GENE.gb/GECH01004907.1/~~gb/GECH01004907.1/.p1  ORF type:complete len:315 (+),score=61.29 gb/GECH01004907.1/:1-945(+)
MKLLQRRNRTKSNNKGEERLFDVHLTLERLEGIPEQTGASIYAKWRNPNKTWIKKRRRVEDGNTEFFGQTQARALQFKPQNCVIWDERFHLGHCHLWVDKNTNTLESYPIKLSVRQIRTHDRRIGRAYIDLAPFALSKKTTQYYLLRDSPYNSTIVVTIEMNQLSGDILYRCPRKSSSRLLQSIRSSDVDLDLTVDVDNLTPSNNTSNHSDSNNSSHHYSHHDSHKKSPRSPHKSSPRSPRTRGPSLITSLLPNSHPQGTESDSDDDADDDGELDVNQVLSTSSASSRKGSAMSSDEVVARILDTYATNNNKTH